MADEIKRQLGIEPQLIKGGGGVFEVVADGTLVFSKKQQGRFPEHTEVMGALKAKMTGT